MSDVEITDDRAKIERRANIVRYKLMRTLQALDRKRHEATDMGLQLRRHATGAAIVAAALSFAVGGVVTLVVLRLVHARERRRRERWSALGRMFRHPERVARSSEPLLPSLFKKAGLALATTVVAQLAKVGVRRLVTAPRKREVAFDTPPPPARAIELR